MYKQKSVLLNKTYKKCPSEHYASKNGTKFLSKNTPYLNPNVEESVTKYKSNFMVPLTLFPSFGLPYPQKGTITLVLVVLTPDCCKSRLIPDLLK